MQIQQACIKAGTDKILELSYLIQGGGNWSFTDSRNLQPLYHGMGQYVYLNFPDISLIEWHPFSISSVSHDAVTSHHIKKIGGANTFTGKLHALVEDAIASNQLQDLRINVEGPYGVPLEYWLYEKIVMVAGGIGITPLHSCFRTLYVLARAGLLPVTRIHLIWVAPSPEYFEIFKETFHTVARDSLHTRFKVILSPNAPVTEP